MCNENEKIMEEIRTMCLEILESQKAMANVPKQIDQINQMLKEIQSDVDETIATAISYGFHPEDHEHRATDLEAI